MKKWLRVCFWYNWVKILVTYTQWAKWGHVFFFNENGTLFGRVNVPFGEKFWKVSR